MRLMRQLRITALALIALTVMCEVQARAQAALLMEEPYGFFGALNPTGHNAIYFQRICAATPVKLRRCAPGEMGAVIARYQGIDGYDWVAIPLLPYLYSVENPADVPQRVNREIVERLRNRYREAHLEDLGPDVQPGNFLHGGWTQLVGAAYERRIYAFRFNTTEKQDDALIARMNAGPDHSDFNLLFENCADFARVILNSYFPHKFRRSIFPDAGMTTPKQIAYKLVKFSRKHPGTQLAIFEIPQIPGYRRMSHANKSIDESFVTTVYAIPIVVLNPYLAGGLFVDYLARGRYHIIPREHEILGPEELAPLTGEHEETENRANGNVQAAAGGEAAPTGIESVQGAQPNALEEVKDTQ
ncbi:MAG: hypothetical protein WBE74_19295 [Terracidiphilus sp.]